MQSNSRVEIINAWFIVRIPKVISSQFPSRGQVMIKGTINDSPLYTAVEPDGKGGHWLHIDAELQKHIKVAEGDEVTLDVEATRDWPEPEIPQDFIQAVQSHEDTKALWARVTPMARWEWVRWVNSTNNPDTRKKRIEVSMSKLRNGLRRPCCFNRNMCCVPEVSRSGVLIGAL